MATGYVFAGENIPRITTFCFGRLLQRDTQMAKILLKNKGGRPPVHDSDRLCRVISVRVTDSEYKEILDKATSLGFKASWYLRKVMVEGSQAVKARPSKAYLHVAARISAISSGITRLIRLAEHRAPLPAELVQMLDSVHAIVRQTLQELRGVGTT